MQWLITLDTENDLIVTCRLMNAFRRKGLKIATLSDGGAAGWFLDDGGARFARGGHRSSLPLSARHGGRGSRLLLSASHFRRGLVHLCRCRRGCSAYQRGYEFLSAIDARFRESWEVLARGPSGKPAPCCQASTGIAGVPSLRFREEHACISHDGDGGGESVRPKSV